MTTTHTPGPWVIEEGSSCAAAIVGGDAIVARLPCWPVETDEQEANASLISAAPDLLEACRNLLEECRLYRIQGGAEEGYSRTMAKARAALAKAEGRQ